MLQSLSQYLAKMRQLITWKKNIAETVEVPLSTVVVIRSVVASGVVVATVVVGSVTHTVN